MLTSRRGKFSRAGFLAFAFLWIPLACVLFTAALVPAKDFVEGLIPALLIAQVSHLVGRLFVHLGHKVVLKGSTQRPGAVRPFSVSTSLLLSLLSLGPGLYLGFLATSLLLPVFGHTWHPEGFEPYKKGLLYGVLLLAFFWALRLSFQVKLEREQRNALQHEMASNALRAKLEVLTAQMNPHLLFNALNSIASLIPHQANAAEHMTLQLSGFYRCVLLALQKESHSLAAELELCRSYMELEKSRFGERLRFSIEVLCSNDIETVFLPVLILQPLVENAVRHGVMRSEEGGTVVIKVYRDSQFCMVDVQDDGQGLTSSPLHGGAGIAITNCEARMRLLFGEIALRFVTLTARVPRGAVASLKIPLPGNEKDLP